MFQGDLLILFFTFISGNLKRFFNQYLFLTFSVPRNYFEFFQLLDIRNKIREFLHLFIVLKQFLIQKTLFFPFFSFLLLEDLIILLKTSFALLVSLKYRPFLPFSIITGRVNIF